VRARRGPGTFRSDTESASFRRVIEEALRARTRMRASPKAARFARCFPEQSLEANASGRAVRGQSRTTKWDAIYRAPSRGSSHIRDRLDAAVVELARGGVRVEPA
jgi:hypothetical protein